MVSAEVPYCSHELQTWERAKTSQYLGIAGRECERPLALYDTAVATASARVIILGSVCCMQQPPK